MRRLRAAIENFFEKFGDSGSENSHADRNAREIKGAIFSLITLFVFIALSSYVPIDSYYLSEKELTEVLNLGGVFGAILAEFVLGNVGAVGYSLIIIGGYLTFASFKGIHYLDISSKIIGIITATLLGSIASFLFFHETMPTGSLWLGGRVGMNVGALFKHYLNTTGALILVSGGAIITLILSTEVSISELFHKIFDGEQEKEDSSLEIEQDPELAPVLPIKKKSKPNSKTSPKKSVAVENDDEFEEEEEEKAKPQTKKKKKAAAKKPKKANTKDDDDALDEETGEEEEGFREILPYEGDYTVPGLGMIKTKSTGGKPTGARQLKKNAQGLCDQLLSFQVTGDILSAEEGPVLTTYEFKPSPGIKLKSIAALEDDLGMAMGTDKLRIMAPIPGRTTVGIEVPRKAPQTISLKEMLSHDNFYDKKLKIPVPLGKSTMGEPIFTDLAAMPHALVAGTTGSGKSVFINSLITAIMYDKSPKDLRFILVDPKMLEFAIFQGLPHLLTDVITDNQKALKALEWSVNEMERRYALMASTGSKNIESYNKKARGNKKLPFIVIIIDELADLMMTAGKEAEIHITRIAQKARACGIHMILATQRPSTNVVTGLIKANIPTRISFKVPSGVDSRTILNAQGAENLIGKGDMLIAQTGASPRRLHGSFVTEEDLKRITDKVKGKKDWKNIYIDM